MAITQNGISGISSTQVATDTLTFSNKTISLGSNTVSGTLAQFNTAISDGEIPDEVLVLMGAY